MVSFKLSGFVIFPVNFSFQFVQPYTFDSIKRMIGNITNTGIMISTKAAFEGSDVSFKIEYVKI